MFPYFISIAILSLITKSKPARLRKMYAQIIENDSVPLTEIPFNQMETYIREYLLRDSYVDIDLMQCTSPSDELPYISSGVKAFYRRTEVIREILNIQNTYAADRTVTIHLEELAEKYGMSYRTLMRERNRFMYHTTLMNLLSDPNKGEDVTDRYPTCCFYCRDYIIARHESAGRPTANSIFRETKNLSDFDCSKCPYNPDVKNGPHGKNDTVPKATCHRATTHMITPNCHDTVNLIISRIPEQETYMAWAGVRAWISKCQHTVHRIKPEKVNYCWFSDHTCLDIIVKTKTYRDGRFDTGRVWLTGVMDAASDALIVSVFS